jgi:glycosyltransferase involved in cell wall biosynthesis
VPQPLVTAVVPLHNHADWVRDAVWSVAKQDYPRKRMVVVDDGSTDGGHRRVLGLLGGTAVPQTSKPENSELWCGDLNGTELFLLRYETAHGPSFARNRGMELLPCETPDDLFAFLDSDDYYQPGKISKSVAEFARYPGKVGVVYSDYDTLRPDGLRLRQFKEPFTRERMLVECLPNCDSLISARAIADCDGFDEDLRVCEDLDLWLRISEKYLVTHLPESLVTIRVGQHSSTATVRNETWQANYRRVFEKLRERSQGRHV